MDQKCRCGHPNDSTSPHPCHGMGHTCGRPAQQRFYNPRPAHLAGVQMKLEVSETWACDECWAWFRGLLRGPLPAV